jgi:transposase
MVRDPQSGRYRRTRLFVLTLGFSRKCVRLIVFTSSARIWAEMHETAFARLGGAPRVLILDNLREGVLKPDIYDPTLNPVYRDMLAHYQAIAMPCRIKDPDRKGKVESSVGHAQNTPLKGHVSRLSPKRRPTWIGGKSSGPTHAFTAPRNARLR